MRKRNSSTSSSEIASAASRVYTWPADGRDLLAVALSVLLALTAMDASLGIAFAYPEGPMAVAGDGLVGSVRRYLEHGRSIEGKLRRRVGPDDAHAAVTITGAWPLKDSELAAFPERPSREGQRLLAGYGMSFTEHVLRKLRQAKPRVELRMVLGPAATLGHSYYRYLEDRHRHHAEVVVLGVLASSMAEFETVTHMTRNFEHPWAHLYPRFYLEGGQLRWQDPPYTSSDEFRRALADPAKFEALVAWLSAYDTFFDPWVFRMDVGDYSIVGRALRRAWGQRQLARARKRVHGPDGFSNATGMLDTARAILDRFVTDVRSRGQLPAVILFDDRGYADHLCVAFGDFLKARKVPTLCSASIAPAENLRNFISDGHFTPEVDGRLAAGLATLLHDNGVSLDE